MEFKNIPVKPEIHKQVKAIAAANFRGLGDQVAYWVHTTCEHPVEHREYFDAMITYPNGPAGVVPARGYKCSLCDHIVLEDAREQAEEA